MCALLVYKNTIDFYVFISYLMTLPNSFILNMVQVCFWLFLFVLNSLEIFVCLCVLSHVQLFAAPWVAACQALLSLEKYWCAVLLPTPRDLPILGSNSCLLCVLHWQADPLPLVPPGEPRKCLHIKLQSCHLQILTALFLTFWPHAFFLFPYLALCCCYCCCCCC